MANVIDELLVTLGFDYDPDDLEAYDKGLEKTISLVANYTAAIVGASAALFGFVTLTTSATDEQGKLSNQTGIAVGKIDALSFALQRAGGDAKQMENSLEQLAIRAGEAARGMGTGVQAFGILGISVTDAVGNLKTADQILLEVSDRMQGVSEVEQIELADKLGLRESILLLQEGRNGINALTNEAIALGVTTEEDARISAEWQDSLVDIFKIIKQLSRVLVRALLPVMQTIADALTEWWKQNRQIIEQNIPKFVTLAAKAMTFLGLAMAGVLASRLPAMLVSLVRLFKTLSIVPLVIGAVIAAVALLVDDAAGFFSGQESFIGDMIKKYPQWADEIEVIATLFNGIAQTIDLIIDGFKEIFGLFTNSNFAEDFNFALQTLKEDTIQFFVDLGNTVKDFFTDIIDDTLGGTFDFFSNIGDKLGFNTTSGDEGRPNTTANSNIVIGDVNVSAEGANDPAAVGDQVSSALLDTLTPLLQQTSKDLNTAVVV